MLICSVFTITVTVVRQLCAGCITAAKHNVTMLREWAYYYYIYIVCCRGRQRSKLYCCALRCICSCALFVYDPYFADQFWFLIWATLLWVCIHVGVCTAVGLSQSGVCVCVMMMMMVYCSCACNLINPTNYAFIIVLGSNEILFGTGKFFSMEAIDYRLELPFMSYLVHFSTLRQ